ncbi:MAG TPA: M28 family metallopeptidase [Steroidobacteraceae bacterium]|nr:M28 family metallopeptidase [Steroidobacteraceae bacterium]
MKTTLLALLAAAMPVCLAAQPDLESTGVPIAAAPADPAIAQALRNISPRDIEHTIASLVAFQNRNTLSSMDQDLPRGQGINAAADFIAGELNRISAACGGCLEVKRDTFTETPQDRIPRPTRITNVYAILRGSDPAQAQRMVLVTGHYDSRNSDTLETHHAAPGANDDASGVAVSIECARVLSHARFPASIVFVAVAGEEQGLNGSHHLAQLAKSQGWQLEAVLNNDIVGGNTTPGDTLQDKSAVRVFSEGIAATATPTEIHQLESLGYESDSPSRELARTVLEVASTYAPAPFHPVLELRRDRFLRGGDHTSFNEAGFPAVRFTEWREDFHHQHQDVRIEGGIQYGDLIQYVDFDYVAHVALVNAATLATLASAPPPPTHVRIVTAALDNATTLQWDAAAHGQYEIVWRETRTSGWQRALAVTPEAGTARVSVPVSKDNVIFGVRALDAAGHRSAAVVPWPDSGR